MITYLSQIIQAFLGPYNPIIVYDSEQAIEYVQYNIEYIVTAIIFIIVLWSVLRIIGGLICSK